jgi:anti-anti-sigma factor
VTADGDRDGLGPIIFVSGDVDVETAEQFWDAVASALASMTDCVTIDLGDVGFIGSTGLNVLVRAHAAVTEANGELVLRSVPAFVTKLLDITGIDTMFRIEP